MLKLSPSQHLVRGCLVPMREHHIPIPAFHRPCASPRNSVSLERLSWYLPRCPATCLPNAVYSVLYALPMYRHQYPGRIVLASLVLSFVRSQDLCTQHAVVLENVPHFRILPSEAAERCHSCMPPACWYRSSHVRNCEALRETDVRCSSGRVSCPGCASFSTYARANDWTSSGCDDAKSCALNVCAPRR